MGKSQTATIERPAAEALAEARERLAVAKTALDTAAARYNSRGTAGDGVALREARKAHEAAQTYCAALEDRAVAEKAANDAAVRMVAKAKIVKLAARREELAKRTDDLVAELGNVISAWCEVDGELHAAWPGPKSAIPVQLGRSRVMALLRSTTAAAGSVIAETGVSPSLASGYKKAAVIAADDRKLLNSAL